MSCCGRCNCGACQSCLSRLCGACCPYLGAKPKDRYAAVEYQPIEIPIHKSLMAARKSLQYSTHYLPHIEAHDFDSESGEEDYDANKQVVKQEPISLARRPKPKLRSFDGEEDLGVELGYIGYDHQEQGSARITRTPEGSPSDESFSSDSNTPSLVDEPQCSRAISYQRERLLQVDSSETPHKPTIQISFYFDDKHDVLIVHLLNAFNLPTKRSESASSPFAEVYMLPNKKQVHDSRTISHTLNPAFDQAFKFSSFTSADISKQMLVVKLYLHTKQHFIGGVLFPLESANVFGSSHTTDIIPFDEEEGIKDKCKGHILLSFTYQPDPGALVILILEAGNLKKQDIIGLPNPYFKVNTCYDGSRISKWKTPAIRNTLNPVFNEVCVLDISSMDVAKLQVEVVVADYDRFGRNSELGSITFGSDVLSSSGRQHWEESLGNPNNSYTYWHPITSESSFRMKSPAKSGPHPVSCVSNSGK